MLLFRVFADMVERNHVFILRMALKLRSAVAKNPLNHKIGEVCGLGGHTFIKYSWDRPAFLLVGLDDRRGPALPEVIYWILHRGG